MHLPITEDDFSAEPISTTGRSTSPTQRVFQTDEKVLELKPSPKGMEAFAYSLVLIGVIASLGVWFLADFSEKKTISGFVLLWFGCAAVGVLGGCIFARLLGTRVRFDRSAGKISILGFRFSPPVEFWTSQIAGIQLLYIGKKHIGDESFRRKLYQLNFIVCKDDGIERFHLLECGKLPLMQTLARASAEFLEVPLFEQSAVLAP